MRARSVLVGFLTLSLVACTSPQEKAYRKAVNEYKSASAAAVNFAQAEVKQLIAATRAFRASAGHWPETFQQLVTFTFANHVPLTPADFNDVTFALLDDGTVQIHYDVNCSRFSTPQYSITQTGSANVKMEKKK